MAKRSKSGNRKFTRQERSKIYKLDKHENVKSANKIIPRGLNPIQKDKRLRMMKSAIIAYTEYYCPAMEAKVAVSKRTIDNFKQKSALGEKSTRAVLDIENVVKNATFIFKDKPKKTASQKGYIWMYVLICPIKGIGYVKLTIGEYSPTDKTNKTSTPFSIYSVLSVSLRRLKK